MSNSEQPAFPESCTSEGHSSNTFKGLTKREYFAGLAMQGLITTGQPVEIEWCVRKADELLKKLES